MTVLQLKLFLLLLCAPSSSSFITLFCWLAPTTPPPSHNTATALFLTSCLLSHLTHPPAVAVAVAVAFVDFRPSRLVS
ncbi:hypothetical protein BD289DRAFT_447778 [Coniella lustricola]|uniref:Secreted peptide n=1 Tax=Coniella lustricola TaxID=2025994 RepID=A0A2T2ZSS4_9PEZI|nr:hypothetical protein BD289DRAFT_447778 [Coniella lustricola]